MKRHLCGMLLGLAAVFSAASASAQGGTWTTRAPMPTARSWAGAGVINDILYVVGGSYNGNGLSTVEAYDWTSNTWTAKAPMPTPRQELAVGVVNGILYAIGGSYSRQVLSTVEAYDPVSNTWTAKAPMPTPRVELAA